MRGICTNSAPHRMEGKQMKVFLLDQGLLLLIGASIMTAIPLLFGTISSIVLELLTVLIWCLLCRQLLLYPLDLLFGKKKEYVYFQSWVSTHEYEFFKNKGFCTWRFVSENARLDLTVPVSCSLDQIASEKTPPKNERLIISYYPFSKILYHWEISREESL